MPEDIFNHPDLRDPEWERLKKRIDEATAPEPPKRKRRGFLARHKGAVFSVFAIAAVVGAGTVLVSGTDRGAVHTSPTSTPTSQEPVRRVDLAQPFSGTPAAAWADGEAAVVVPAATPMGRFSAEEVAEVLGAVR
ncbi:hypothetical protein [Actinokineospora pegani]|uniref:hypothetical protein n=1 Tax=Actinokineospora pegani TaxID=2654637 RepID=UPI0012E9BEC1|nr:hypothetical protein [Actinokineospora pegani]